MTWRSQSNRPENSGRAGRLRRRYCNIEGRTKSISRLAIGKQRIWLCFEFSSSHCLNRLGKRRGCEKKNLFSKGFSFPHPAFAYQHANIDCSRFHSKNTDFFTFHQGFPVFCVLYCVKKRRKHPLIFN